MEKENAKNTRKEVVVKKIRRINGLEKDAKKHAKWEEFVKENNSEKIWFCPWP